MDVKLISLDMLARVCPYFYNGESFGGYNCKHPKQGHCQDGDEKKEGICASFSCPIAYEADYPEMKKFDTDLAEEYREEYEKEGDNDSSGWMVLYDNDLIQKLGKNHEYLTPLLNEA